VRTYVQPLLTAVVERILQAELDKDARSLLQEWSQAHLGHTPVYRTISAEGPDHAKAFTVQVSVGGRVYGQGSGRSKQSASQAAAEAALIALAAESPAAEAESESAPTDEGTSSEPIPANSLPPLPPGQPHTHTNQ